MVRPRPTRLAWMILREAVSEGDTVIDATAGNGYDTVFLAECAGLTGRVLAFDIQEAAIHSARRKVVAAGFGSRVEFHHRSHGRMAGHAELESVAAVMFNLGYLPGGNHEVTTQAPETLNALAAAAGLLKPGGILSVVCYPGHPAGAVESIEVESWINDRTADGWQVEKYGISGTSRPAPFLLIARKTRAP